VLTTPNNMPNEFVIDISDLKPGDVIRLADLPLPAGVTATGDPEMPIVTVIMGRNSGPAAAAEGGAEAPAAE
jgi:hypothetical protein